jgi:hypothetical protein
VSAIGGKSPKDTQMTEQSCGNCRFWKRIHENNWEPDGICRRYSPGIDHYGITKRPASHHDEWCGEWKTNDKEVLAWEDNQMELMRHINRTFDKAGNNP